MERAKGFEPSAQNSKGEQNQASQQPAQDDCTQIRAQILGELGPELEQVVAAWSLLSQPLKAAILAIVNSSDMARLAGRLEVSAGEASPKSNFPAVHPSTVGSQLNTTENLKEKVNSL